MVSPSDVVHPFDQAAWRELESAVDLAPTVAAFTELWAGHGGAAGGPDRWPAASRLGPDRWPDVYRLLPPICAAFGIAEPALYLAPGEVRAHAFGPPATIVLFSDLLDQLATDELVAVLARECGHLLLHSMWHRSMALCLDASPDVASIIAPEVITGLSAVTSSALRDSVRDWSGKSELSADRAAAAYLGDPDAITRVMFRLASTDTGGVGAAGDGAAGSDVGVGARGPGAAGSGAADVGAAGFGVAGLGGTGVGAALRVREVQAWAATPGFARLITRTATPAGAGR